MSELMQRFARLPREQRAEFLAMLRGGADQTLLRPRERTGAVPASAGQASLWFIDQLTPGLPMYNVICCLRLVGRLDPDRFRAALTRVCARHESLRTGLVEQDGAPAQEIAAPAPAQVPVVAAAGADPDARFASAQILSRELARIPFDLSQPPLWRAALYQIGPDDHLFTFVVHHSIFDGWSTGPLLADLAQAYRTGGELPELPVQYADYAYWQRDRLDGDGLAPHRRYWREHLAGAPVAELPGDRPRTATASYHSGLAERVLPTEAIDAAQRLALQRRRTPAAVYLAAFYALLHAYTGIDDLVIGFPTANRDQRGLDELVGYFVNLLPLRVNVADNPSFQELVDRVGDVLRGALAHAELPLDRVVQEVSPIRDEGRTPLFQVTFGVLEDSGVTADFGELQVHPALVHTGTAHFDMAWNLTPDPAGLGVFVEYRTDLFDPPTVDDLLDAFGNQLRRLLADPATRIGRHDVVPEATARELVRRWAGPVRPVPAGTLPERFAAQARAAPDAVAIVARDQRLRYDDLNRRANRLAHRLRARGVRPGQLVALALPRGVPMVTAMLAVLKAGAAYLPLDPSDPPARLSATLADAGAHTLVTQTSGPAGWAGSVLCLPELADELAAAPEADPPPAARPQDPAYVIYTSGSTGVPKGVVITHASVVSFIASVRQLFDLTPDDRFLGFASYTFDVSVFETFGALLTGGSLHVVTEEERLDVDRLQARLEEAAVTVVDLPPPVMALLAPERLPKLRIAFVGGEAFPGELVNRWSRDGRRFFNGYGPTECTVTMIVQECQGRWDASPPIGLPMANHVAYVLDRRGRQLPYGVPGELVIGGAGLACGYLHRPALTAERFVPDPFGGTPGGRLYRTGDLVKRQRDGALVFLGRTDRQVKLRGLRVEPGEIESLLAGHPGVAQVAVVPWTDRGGNQHLVAYLSGRAGGLQPPADELRAFAAERMPPYLVPTLFVPLAELPVSSSGKVDRAALPVPEMPTPDAEVGPRGETERVLAEEVFAQVIGGTGVGVTRTFFELGGTSLGAARALSMIRRRFEVEIGVADFFRLPTVAGLAALINRRRAAALDDDSLLRYLAEMSDEDAERLLAADAGGS